jgi:hypothetical protein
LAGGGYSRWCAIEPLSHDREVLISALSTYRKIKSPGIVRGLFCCVPSMIDSLEVEVLYPA